MEEKIFLLGNTSKFWSKQGPKIAALSCDSPLGMQCASESVEPGNSTQFTVASEKLRSPACDKGKHLKHCFCSLMLTNPGWSPKKKALHVSLTIKLSLS